MTLDLGCSLQFFCSREVFTRLELFLLKCVEKLFWLLMITYNFVSEFGNVAWESMAVAALGRRLRTDARRFRHACAFPISNHGAKNKPAKTSKVS